MNKHIVIFYMYKEQKEEIIDNDLRQMTTFFYEFMIPKFIKSMIEVQELNNQDIEIHNLKSNNESFREFNNYRFNYIKKMIPDENEKKNYEIIKLKKEREYLIQLTREYTDVITIINENKRSKKRKYNNEKNE